MSIEANKAVVSRYMEMWNTGNVALADEVLVPTYALACSPCQWADGGVVDWHRNCPVNTW